MQALPRALQAAQDRHSDPRRDRPACSTCWLASRARSRQWPRVVEPLPDVPPWPETEKLQYEKEVLDFYFSSHPLTLYERDAPATSHTIADLKGVPDGQEVTVAGMLVNIRFRTPQNARNGNNGQNAYFALEDFSGSFRVRDLVRRVPRNKDACERIGRWWFGARSAGGETRPCW